MRESVIAAAVFLVAVFQGATASAGAALSSGCAPAVLAIDGNQIWARTSGSGSPTVVFEAGFGNDSTAWSPITKRLQAARVRMFVYDRAGMGKSTINAATPYSLQNDVQILRTALDDCHVTGPVVFVGHSYGGAIGLVAAGQDARIQGLVLIEAVVPGVWTQDEVDRNLKSMRPQYEEIRAQAPALALVAIPWAEAMPQSAQLLNTLPVSESLPILDIEADHGQSDPASEQIWTQAHKAFVSGHVNRSRVVAAGSSHKVMADRPDLVVAAIRKMIRRVRVASVSTQRR